MAGGGEGMHRVLFMECGIRGLLTVNGQFFGPLEACGQAFPASDTAEIYIQFFPFSEAAKPMILEMQLRAGQIIRLEPQTRGFALLWPDGIIQLELRPEGMEESSVQERTEVCSGVLLRYLAERLRGNPSAGAALLHPEQEVPLEGYEAVVPLRFAPLAASDRFDERAGLVRRLSENTARIDAALAMTVPAGQGRRMIERVEILKSDE